MLTKKSFIFPLSIMLFVLFLCSAAKAQDIPNENDTPVVDSIDYGENLLDSNEVYKKQFDSLSKDGEWVEMNKADFIISLLDEAGEDIETEYLPTTEVIYIWRPYCADNYWNPYTNGNWVFSSFGWVWTSYYNWGWGPYNYGRWYFSSFYGWTWVPGCRYAANWVTWRCNDQYVGWYPTCPQIYWSGEKNVYSNRLFTYVPKNWVFVNKNDFTKKIDKRTVVDNKNNAAILKDTKKIKTAVYTDPEMPKIKYAGPEVNEIAKATGEKISPKEVKVVNSKDTKYTAETNNSTYEKRKSATVKGNNTQTKTQNTGVKKNTEKDQSKSTKTKNIKTPKDTKSKDSKAPKSTKSRNSKSPKGTKIKKTQKIQKSSGDGYEESNPVKTNAGSTEPDQSETNNASQEKPDENVEQEATESTNQQDNKTSKGSNAPGSNK